MLRKLGWRVAVIQSVDSVAAFATDIEWRITAVLSALGVAAALGGISVARRLTRRISRIAQSADAVSRGGAQHIEVPRGHDEAARLGAALERLLASLQRERDELRTLNAELDQRVADRTEEIRRLAHESRDAAVVRERLRLARALHDTLAHSMMAMLTEIRVLKRLASTQPQQLPEELVRAEQAAREGPRRGAPCHRPAAQQPGAPGRAGCGAGGAGAQLRRAPGHRGDLHDRPVTGRAGQRSRRDRVPHGRGAAAQHRAPCRRAAGADRAAARARRPGLPGGGRRRLRLRPAGAWCPGTTAWSGLHEQAQAIGAQLQIDSRPGHGTRVRLCWAQSDGADVSAARPSGPA